LAARDEQALSADELQTTAPHRGELARALALTGQEAAARAAIDALLEYLDRGEPAYHLCLAPVVWTCGWLAERDAAAATGALARLERLAAWLDTAEAAASLAEGAGMVLAVSDATAGSARLRLAVEQWGRLDRPFDAVRAQVRLGAALAVSGDTTGARHVLDAALATIDDLACRLADAELRQSFLDAPLASTARTVRRALAAGHATRTTI
jgi:hypothetical protein